MRPSLAAFAIMLRGMATASTTTTTLIAIMMPLAIAARLSCLFLEQKGSSTPTTQQMGNSQPICSAAGVKTAGHAQHSR